MHPLVVIFSVLKTIFFCFAVNVEDQFAHPCSTIETAPTVDQEGKCMERRVIFTDIPGVETGPEADDSAKKLDAFLAQGCGWLAVLITAQSCLAATW